MAFVRNKDDVKPGILSAIYKPVISITLTAVLLVLPVAAVARIALPANQGERDRILGLLRRIASDYQVEGEEFPAGSGNWRVKIIIPGGTAGPAPQPVPDVGEIELREPKGDELVLKAVRHSKTIKINLVPGRGAGTRADPNTSDNRRKRGRRGVGTDSEIRIGSGLTDNSIEVLDGTDAAGNIIWIDNPLWIILAHELIHGLHNADGTRSPDSEGQTISRDENNGHGITENDLRSEHRGQVGGPRQGHGGRDTGH